MHKKHIILLGKVILKEEDIMFVIGLIIGFLIGLSAGCIIFAIIVSRHNICNDIYDIISEMYSREATEN